MILWISSTTRTRPAPVYARAWCAGRQNELDAFAAAVTRAELARPIRGLVLTGLRGVGKTVLLNEMANHVEDKDWVVVRLEVAPAVLRRRSGS